MSEVTDSVEEMVAKVTDAEESSSGIRSVVEGLIEDLEVFKEPIESGIASIEQQADNMGVPFG